MLDYWERRNHLLKHCILNKSDIAGAIVFNTCSLWEEFKKSSSSANQRFIWNYESHKKPEDLVERLEVVNG